jgi:hypothetical protein
VYTGDGSSGIYIWGAQVEEASTASSYQPILSTFESAFKAANPNHTLYQDYQGVTPVTAVGQPVGLMLDKSEGLKQGPELITNGDFSNGTTDWVAAGGTMSVVSGELEFTATATGHLVRQLITVEPNHTYKFSWSARLGTAPSAKLSVYDDTGSSNIISPTVYSASSTSQVFSVTFTTPANCVSVGIYPVRDSNVTGTYYIDNISVKEIQGSHATQPTSTKRPIYARHPEGGIRNLLNYTEQFDNSYWSKGSNSTLTAGYGTAPDGNQTAYRLQMPTSGGTYFRADNVSVVVGKKYTFSIYAKAVSGTSDFDMFNQVSGNYVQSGTKTATSEWQRFSFTSSAAVATALRGFGINNFDDSYATDILIWGWQVEEATEASNYQKRVTDIDVTESGVGEVYYLKFDGVDDGMMINNLSSPSTPVTALFGYSAVGSNPSGGRYLLDVQTGRIVFAASTVTAGHIGYFDGGWSEFAADSDAIKVLTYDLVENDAKIRIDGTQEYADTTYVELGLGGQIGLFQNYPFTGSFLAGNMYQTILRAAESTDEEIAKAESFVANKTGLKAQVDGIATLDLNFGNNTYTAKNSNGGVI